jgi:O-antigen ligase
MKGIEGLSSRSPGKTLAQILPWFMPVILLGGFALLGGGFDLQTRHAAGILAWLLVAGLLLSSWSRSIRFGKPFLTIAAILLALSILSAVSSMWSSSTARSLVEAERFVAYLGFFSVAFLVCQSDLQRKRFVEGLFIAVALVIVLAISDRLLPGTAISPVTETARLRFPLGYWNANGLVSGIAVLLFAWITRFGGSAALRWLAAGLIPVAMVTLYLTYSRGGLLAAVTAVVCMFFLSEHRLRIVAVVGVGVLASIPTLLVLQSNPAIAENLGGPDAPAQGRAVAQVLGASMLASVLLQRALLELAARKPLWAGRALGTSRDKRLLKAVATGGALVLLTLAVVFGPRVWAQFSEGDLDFPNDPESQFVRFSGAGRYDFSRVAVESFVSEPATGSGAGTFIFEWSQRRNSELVAQDAHSIYLEAFGEMGIIGGLLVLALIVSMVRFAVYAWLRSRGAARDRSAMLLSILLALTIALGIDWTWELAATASLLMMVAACLVCEFQARRDAGRHSAGETVLRKPRRSGPGVQQIAAGVAVSWFAIAALAIPLAADRYMEASASAASEGRLDDSIRSARRAAQLNPWSPAPHLQLGAIAQQVGLYERSIAEYSKAAEMEPENWQPPYLESLVEAERGELEAAAHKLAIALRLNPRSALLNEQRLTLEATASGEG